MLISTNIYSKRLLQKLKNHCNNFFNSLELFLGKSFVVPFFYLYSHNTNNPAHINVAEDPSGEIPGSIIYVNTTKGGVSNRLMRNCKALCFNIVKLQIN